MYDFLVEFIYGTYKIFLENVHGSMDLLTEGLRSNASMSSTIDNVMSICEGLALTVISVLFLVDLLQNTLLKADELRFEDILKCLLKLLIAKSVCSFSGALLETIYTSVAEIIVQVNPNVGSSYTLSMLRTLIEDNVPKGSGFFDVINQIMYFLTQLINIIILVLCGLLIKVMSYGRMIEIYILLAISPISMSFIPWKGTSEIPKKFILSFAAVCLQGLVMIVCVKVYEGLLMSLDASDTNMNFTFLIYACVLIFAIFTSGKWAKQLVGM